jgi:signal peptidase I
MTLEDSAELAVPPAPTADAAEAPIREKRRLVRLRILLPFLLLAAFLAWAFSTNYIPSESMVPTLQPGDHILTMRAWLAYPGGRTPSRGDIITFLPPESASLEDGPPQKPGLARREVWIKRVVGLPNETIWIGQGSIFVNGSALPRQYYVGHPNLSFWRFPYASAMPLRLKSDEVFVIGDNPDNSDDSRSWGPLPVGLVVGRYVRILFREGPRGPNRRRLANQR